MQCNKCGSEMWDNRPKKQSGQFKATSPDFKCRDKTCDGVIWPPKNGDAPKAQAPTGKPNVAELILKKIEGLEYTINQIYLLVQKQQAVDCVSGIKMTQGELEPDENLPQF